MKFMTILNNTQLDYQHKFSNVYKNFIDLKNKIH